MFFLGGCFPRTTSPPSGGELFFGAFCVFGTKWFFDIRDEAALRLHLKSKINAFE